MIVQHTEKGEPRVLLYYHTFTLLYFYTITRKKASRARLEVDTLELTVDFQLPPEQTREGKGGAKAASQPAGASAQAGIFSTQECSIV